jgi:transposase-like protein/IS1 family transposase
MTLCSHCSSENIQKRGFFYLKHSSKYVQRYFCRDCKKSFSPRTFALDAYQHKPFLNDLIKKLLCEGSSMRSLSRVFHVTYATIYRKFLFLSEYSIKKRSSDFHTLYFDEMETLEHTKCKPLSISLFVTDQYELLSALVAQMPCKGKLAKISRAKYGYRKDERHKALNAGLKQAQSINQNINTVMTDGKSQYKKLVSKYFPKAEHKTHTRNQKLREQEKQTLHEGLKRKVYDPMFTLNQRCALLRDKINRLTRRSWCTTKKPENLQRHLNLFIDYHNQVFMKTPILN